ncbi:hypothetical protein [Peterkaempfera griseoplana]|uniref:hypothetical protein n=1 Tax=Peterkaempfera griseoplana TaxID=66896 RepID=UPI0006E13649|nr:hypothetical protein [Peterkaempfera griseoplana]
MRGSRAAALLVGLAAALTSAACGVPPSDVIQAGAPASGLSSPRPERAAPSVVALYFLHDGALRPYLRKARDPADLKGLVHSLFAGPSAGEAATATTDLPRLKSGPEVWLNGDGTLSVQLPGDVPLLSRRAMLQLACTVAEVAAPSVTPPADIGGGAAAPLLPARRSAASAGVHVVGNGWTMTQSAAPCPGVPQRRP